MEMKAKNLQVCTEQYHVMSLCWSVRWEDSYLEIMGRQQYYFSQQQVQLKISRIVFPKLRDMLLKWPCEESKSIGLRSTRWQEILLQKHNFSKRSYVVVTLAW